ncbi:hypothetical protein NMY22_g16699 [Coprinellus aureogranulatus]|nr:hypothetical protein NMY22_g16699 [Coprinellus aureogranulatus]
MSVKVSPRFPEEPLDLPAHEGGGYFPGQINGTLDDGRYKIIRKLGYGPRSSTWLVLELTEEEHFAVKIYTLAASPLAGSTELPMVQRASHDLGVETPFLKKHFWEKTNNGAHLCVLATPTSISIRALVRETRGSLPLGVIQKVVSSVAFTLSRLHQGGIFHGDVRPEHVLLSSKYQGKHLKAFLETGPSPTIVKVKKYTTVRSQPLPYDLIWEGKKANIIDRQLYLVGYGHSQVAPYHFEGDHDYYSAPETLLYQDHNYDSDDGAHKSYAVPKFKADVWMLGCLAFHLLTGSPPFHFKRAETNSRTIPHIAAALGLKLFAIPWNWNSDRNMKKGPQVEALRDLGKYVHTIDARLQEVLDENDAAEAASFIKACLCINPKSRISAKEAWSHPWLSRANACMCGYYCKRETCGRH